MIVDAHVHLWDLDRAPQPWMTAEHAVIARPFAPAELAGLLESQGIDAVILVQGACVDSDTDFLLELAASNPWIGSVTGWIPLDQPQRAAQRLEQLLVHPQLRAVRHLVHQEPARWLLRSGVLTTLAALEELDLILEIPVVFPDHFEDVVVVAERFPRLRIVIDHLGKPPIATSAMSAWREALAQVAEHPAVSAKISGLNTAVRGEWTLETLRPSVEHALDCFGPERLMCGSDWPVALLNGSYEKVWRTTVDLVEMLAPASADALLGENARRLYGLGSTARAAP